MELPPSSPYLNAIENLWLVVKMKLYEGCKQYKIKAELLEAIKTIRSENELKI